MSRSDASAPRRASPDVSFVVGEDEAGLRLDVLVVRKAAASGRRGVATLFGEGAVHVDGRTAKKGDRARAGTTVDVRGAGGDPVLDEPDAPLDVRLERPDLVVVYKPAGQATAPLHGEEPGTLAGALLGRYEEMRGVGHRAREPGLLHRLDTQTSGLVVAARSSAVFEHLARELSAGKIDKRYLAIVRAAGSLEPFVVNEPLEPDPSDPRRVRVADQAAARPRRSTTRVRVVSSNDGWALVEVTASPAYRHQVRVHLAHAGHPIAGDALYGGPAVERLGARHALHASYVAWAGDDVVPAFAVEAPLPEDLAALVRG